MKKTKFFVSHFVIFIAILTLLAITNGRAFANFSGINGTTGPQWIALDSANEGSEPEVTALTYDESGMQVDLQIHGFYIENIEIPNYGWWNRVTLPGQAYLGETGAPDLPVLRRLFSIPGTTDLNVVLENIEYATYGGLKVDPLQPLLKEKDKPTEFQLDEKIYGTNEFYPTGTASTAIAGIMRGVRLGSLIFKPFQFNPISGVLQVAKKITLKVEFKGYNSENAVLKESRITSLPFAKVFKKILLNREFLSFTRADLDCGIDYLIIADHNLYNAFSLQLLKSYHESQGMTVAIVDVSTIGNTADQIKSYIQAEYNSIVPADLDYVLLVGDVSVIPFKQNAYSGYNSDIWYAWLQGGDYIGDVGLGRFPARNLTELNNMVNKSLNKHRNYSPGLWQNKTCLIANKEQYPQKYTACKESIFNYTYALYPPIFDKMYGGDPAFNWTNTDLSNMINDGRGVINYRGHGDTQMFWNWNRSSQDYTVTNVQGLTNGTKTPIIFSIACSTLNMESALETLGEAFMRPSQGAVAFLGAIHPSYTTINHDFDRLLYKGVWDLGLNRIGDLLNSADASLYSLYQDSYVIKNITMYLWLGDPALPLTNYWTVYNPVVHQDNLEGIQCLSPAAVTSMIINKLADINPSDTVVPASQLEVIDFIDQLTGTQMANIGSSGANVLTIMEQFTGDGACSINTNGVWSSHSGVTPTAVQGPFNWSLFRKSNVNQILYDIAYWQQQNQYEAAVPTHGNYCKWVAIEGVSSEVPPSQQPNVNNYPLRGFFIDDPSATGGYHKTFKTAHFWKNPAWGYYLPTNGNNYEAIIEPPPVSGSVSIVEPFNPQWVEEDNCNPYTLMELASKAVYEMELTQNTNFSTAYEETFAGEPIWVERIDLPDGGYYLVPFHKDQTQVVSVVILLSKNGQFIESAYSNEKEGLNFPSNLTKDGQKPEFYWEKGLTSSPYEPLCK
ncbi:MAG TPA: C25 family cysteine peptidase [Candidatus Kapabacteria bacterium]|nr:C25 family cysteine peptidase [Candidatus Kapabacteria bacterium]